jgi:hypothetical protein
MSRTAGAAGAVDVVRMRVAAGMPVGRDLELGPRVARAVALADEVGAPVLDALDAAAAAEDDAARSRRAVAVASAQSRAVAAGLLVAPLVLVPGLGRLVGVDLVGFYASGAGRVVLAVGLTMLAVGALVIRTLVLRVEAVRHRAPGPRLTTTERVLVVVAALVTWIAAGPALVAPVAAVAVGALRRSHGGRRSSPAGVDEPIDLVATALTGSVGNAEALRLTAEGSPELAPALRRLALDLELGAVGGVGPTEPDAVARLRALLTTAEEVGAAPSAPLRRLAADLRAEELARVLAAAERLPAQLTFPTTLLLLPATVLLIGAPIVHAGLGSTVW